MEPWESPRVGDAIITSAEQVEGPLQQIFGNLPLRSVSVPSDAPKDSLLPDAFVFALKETIGASIMNKANHLLKVNFWAKDRVAKDVVATATVTPHQLQETVLLKQLSNLLPFGYATVLPEPPARMVKGAALCEPIKVQLVRVTANIREDSETTVRINGDNAYVMDVTKSLRVQPSRIRSFAKSDSTVELLMGLDDTRAIELFERLCRMSVRVSCLLLPNNKPITQSGGKFDRDEQYYLREVDYKTGIPVKNQSLLEWKDGASIVLGEPRKLVNILKHKGYVATGNTVLELVPEKNATASNWTGFDYTEIYLLQNKSAIAKVIAALPVSMTNKQASALYSVLDGKDKEAKLQGIPSTLALRFSALQKKHIEQAEDPMALLQMFVDTEVFNDEKISSKLRTALLDFKGYEGTARTVAEQSDKTLGLSRKVIRNLIGRYSATIAKEIIRFMIADILRHKYTETIAKDNSSVVGVHPLYPTVAFVRGTAAPSLDIGVLREWGSNATVASGARLTEFYEAQTNAVVEFLKDHPKVTDIIGHSRGAALAYNAARRVKNVRYMSLDGAATLAYNMGDGKSYQLWNRNLNMNSLLDSTLDPSGFQERANAPAATKNQGNANDDAGVIPFLKSRLGVLVSSLNFSDAIDPILDTIDYFQQSASTGIGHDAGTAGTGYVPSLYKKLPKKGNFMRVSTGFKDGARVRTNMEWPKAEEPRGSEVVWKPQEPEIHSTKNHYKKLLWGYSKASKIWGFKIQKK